MHSLTKREAGALAVVLVVAASATAETINVPGDQPTIADAIAVAQTGDIIVVADYMFGDEPIIDWLSKPVRIESTGSLDQPAEGLYKLGVGATVASATGDAMMIRGELRSPTVGSADAHAEYFNQDDDGRVLVQAGAQLNISASEYSTLGGALTVADAGTLSFSLPLGDYVYVYGEITLLASAQLNITSDLLVDGTLTGANATVTAGGRIDVGGSCTLNGGGLSASDELYVGGDAMVTLYDTELTVADECANYGVLRMFDGLLMTRDLYNYGQLDLLDVTLSAEQVYNDWYDEVTGSGFWVTNIHSRGDWYCTGDTTVVGDVDNDSDGTITIYTGTLTILGALTNDGTIIGAYRGERDRGDWRGISVGGDFVAGYNAQLHLPSAALGARVDGDYDVGIGSNTQYDMRQATLVVGSLAGAAVEFEVMSADIGPSAAGLDRTQAGHYPIGTLHIAGATVNLVDSHDNDYLGWEQPEAIYVDSLQIDAGATLNTSGYRIYYNTLVNEGLVDEPANLILIGSGVTGDLDGDGDVDLADLAEFLGYYGLCTGEPGYNPAADFDGNGCVDLSDLAELLGNYGL